VIEILFAVLIIALLAVFSLAGANAFNMTKTKKKKKLSSYERYHKKNMRYRSKHPEMFLHISRIYQSPKTQLEQTALDKHCDYKQA